MFITVIRTEKPHRQKGRGRVMASFSPRSRDRLQLVCCFVSLGVTLSDSSWNILGSILMYFVKSPWDFRCSFSNIFSYFPYIALLWIHGLTQCYLFLLCLLWFLRLINAANATAPCCCCCCKCKYSSISWRCPGGGAKISIHQPTYIIHLQNWSLAVTTSCSTSRKITRLIMLPVLRPHDQTHSRSWGRATVRTSCCTTGKCPNHPRSCNLRPPSTGRATVVQLCKTRVRPPTIWDSSNRFLNMFDNLFATDFDRETAHDHHD